LKGSRSLAIIDAIPGISDRRNGEVMATADVPQYHELLWPALQALGELGGSASTCEIVETVVKREGFSDAQQS
jgi:hypothetical protein